jgi:hypothetical protein
VRMIRQKNQNRLVLKSKMKMNKANMKAKIVDLFLRVRKYLEL